MSFKLDRRLEQDSSFVAEIGISQVRLSHDSRYPWLLVIPQINECFELDELSFNQQIDVMKASNIISKVLKDCFSPDKLNIACLGNIVKQLHIHHVARFEYDAVWPGPIWGQGVSVPYVDNARETQLVLLRDSIANLI
ncbi:MAG: diadenosine tetraphosphate (Ap4A) HIT family hydrolase [Alphaproteobacteria bacterium]|jgi:diadenosine tetraphosphate (Ap4A) HIT family hydrolase